MNRLSPRPKPSATRARYAECKRLLWLRSQGWCERPDCGQMAHDPHHVRKPRGSNHQFIIALCRSDHEWLDAPVTGPRGRLGITVEEGDPMLIVTFRIRGGPDNGWEKAVVLTPLLPREGPP